MATRYLLTAVVWMALTLPLGSVWAQTPQSAPTTTQPAKPLLTTEFVETRIAQTENATSLGEETKKRVLEQYRQALADLQAAAEWARQASEFEKLRGDAPGLLEAIRAELAQPAPEVDAQPPADASLQQLEQRLAEEQSRLKSARDQAALLDTERARRADRRAGLPELIVKARARLDEVTALLAASAPADVAPEVNAARLVSLQARKTALEAEINCYEKEVSSYDARGELLTARRDKAARAVTLSQATTTVWQEIVNERRRREAEAAAAAARQDQVNAARQHPVLQQLTEDNADLTERRTERAEQIAATTTEFDQTTKLRTRLASEFTTLRSKVQAAGLTYAMGQLLRQRREHLPDLRLRQRLLEARRKIISDIQVELIELEDRRSELLDLDQAVRELMADLQPPAPPARQRFLEAAGRELLQTQRQFVDDLLTDSNTYFQKLVDLDGEERLLIAEVSRIGAYIDERVLWIPSTNLPRWSDVGEAGEAFGWLVAPQHWTATARALWRSSATDPGPLLLGMPVLLILGLTRRRMRAAVVQLGGSAAKGQARVFAPTFQVLILSALLAVFWPALLMFVAWRIHVLPEATDFATAVAAGLQAAALFLLPTEFLRQTLRPHGLARAHFDWPSASVALFRRSLLTLVAVGLPLAFVTAAIDATSTSTWQNSLGRLAFVAGQFLLAAFAWRVLHPSGAILKGDTTSSPLAPLRRFRVLWFGLGFVLPLLLVVLAIAGYYYTALQLSGRLFASAALALTLLLAIALALRWVLISRRRLAIDMARQRRSAAQAEVKDETESSAVVDATEPLIDLSAISTQTGNLLLGLGTLTLLLGFWFIWVDVLPALGILDNVELWTRSVKVTESGVNPDGVTVVRTAERSEPVTLADLAAALLTLFVGLIAMRNLPGLLEISLLQRLPLKAGERYGITTAARYAIIVIAIVVAANALGIGWSKVQWLVAAVTVGLGFGLQEIFANFVSGLIILFERPIRIGDIVTVGNVTGTVSQIRIRATTVTDWDCKELVIPNKEFVTGQVINWSLSDQVLRLVIPVGIAYGSDTQRAQRVLLDIAHHHPRVLEKPKPKAFFLSFGDSALSFELRVWVKDIDDWILARNELHFAVDNAFRAAGIEIAFPQRDIHIRSIRDELPITRSGARPASDSPRDEVPAPHADEPDEGD